MLVSMMPIVSMLILAAVGGGLVAGVRHGLLTDRAAERPGGLRLVLHVLMVALVLALALLIHAAVFAMIAWLVGVALGALLAWRRRRSQRASSSE